MTEGEVFNAYSPREEETVDERVGGSSSEDHDIRPDITMEAAVEMLGKDPSDITKRIWEVYEVLYAEATPSANFYRQMVLAEENHYDNNLYLLFYLPQDKFEKIVDREVEATDLDKYGLNETSFRAHISLGSAPCSNRNRVEKAREKEGLTPI